MSVPPTIDLEALLSQDAWIRRLARQLIRDPHSADDLVQDAWLAALSAREDGARARALRPWLAGIVRNLWRDRARGGARREHRERAAARREATGSTDELVAELELRKHVAECLLALEEPYRRALVLRFFKDCSLAAIARREEISVSSVHERIRRGLARLQARLDREHGGERGAWAPGLFLLADRATRTGRIVAGKIAGGIAMGTGIKVAAFVLVAVGALAWMLHGRGSSAGESERTAAAPGAPAVSSSVRPEDVELVSLADPQRQAVERDGARLASEAPPAEPVPSLIHGRVVDSAGSAVAGVPVQLQRSRESDAAPTAISAADGSFTLDVAEDERWANLRCLDPRFTTLVPGSGELEGERLVVVAARASFAGQVVDASGTPIEGAELVFRPRSSLFRELGIQQPRIARVDGWQTKSDGAGRFSFSELAGGPHVGLEVTALGFQAQNVDLPAQGDLALSVVLEPEAEALELLGRVLGPDGLPFAGARVSAGREVVSSSPDGSFRLVSHRLTGRHVQGEDGVWRPEESESVRLIALAPQHLPALEELAPSELGAPVVLQLGAAPLTISGHVVAPDGRRLPGIVVWPRELTPFARDWADVTGGEKTVEEELCETRYWIGTVTEADGAFELGCLVERAYDLELFEGKTATRRRIDNVRAGSHDLELVLDPEPGTTRVAGRVVTADGQPVPGATIWPRRSADLAPGATPPQLVGGEFWVKTDEEGRFEFPALATQGTTLDVSGPPFQFLSLADFGDLEHIEIVRPRLCELQVLLRDPALADVLGVFDERGEELSVIERVLYERNQIAFTDGPRAEITDGRSSVIQVPETARTLVLFRKDIEVLRLAIHPDPAQRMTITP